MPIGVSSFTTDRLVAWLSSMTDLTIGTHGASVSYAFLCIERRSNMSRFIDVEIHHLETRQPLHFENLKVVAKGPLRASVSAEVKLGKSVVNVTVR